MYENYLLNASAIAAVANEIDGFRTDRPILGEEVERIIREKQQKLDFYCRGTKQVPADWTQGIDGARVLSEVFAELSESRVSFEKTKHSVGLTKWLIRNNPESLREVAELLIKLLAVRTGKESQGNSATRTA